MGAFVVSCCYYLLLLVALLGYIKQLHSLPNSYWGAGVCVPLFMVGDWIPPLSLYF